MIKNYIASFCFLILISCSVEQVKENYIFKIGDSYEIKNKDVSKLSEIYELSKIIPLETNEFSLIGQVSKLVINDDRIIILDKTCSKVFVFSSTGTHLYSSQKGKGPYEVSQVSDFSINENKLYILSTQHKKVVIFDLEGLEPIKEIKTDFYAYNMESSVGGTFSFLNAETRGITLTSSDLKPTYNTEYSGKFEFILPLRPFIKTTGNQQQILYSQGLDSIYNVGQSGLDLKYTFDFGNRSVGHNEIKNAQSERDLLNIVPDLNRSCFVNNFFLDNNLVYLTFMAFGFQHEVFHCFFNYENSKKFIFSDNNISDDIFYNSRLPIPSFINETNFYIVKDPSEIPDLISETIFNFKKTNNPIIFILTIKQKLNEKIF